MFVDANKALLHPNLSYPITIATGGDIATFAIAAIAGC